MEHAVGIWLADGQATRSGLAAGQQEDDDHDEDRDADRNEPPRQVRGALDAAQRHRREEDDGADPEQPLGERRSGREIGAEGQRHRRAGRGLPRDEAPARGEAPPRPEPLTSVDVRSS